MFPDFPYSFVEAHYRTLSPEDKELVVDAFGDIEPNKEGFMPIDDIIKKVPPEKWSPQVRKYPKILKNQILNTDFQQDADDMLLKRYCQPKDELSNQYKANIDFYNKLINEFKEILVSKKLSYEEYKVVRAIIDLLEENKKKPYEDELAFLEEEVPLESSIKNQPRNKRCGFLGDNLYIAKVPMTTD